MVAQGQTTYATVSTISYPKVAQALGNRIEWFSTKSQKISRYAVASKHAGAIPEFKAKNDWLQSTRDYLNLLEFDTNMSPALRTKARIDTVLDIINRDGIHFPDDVKQRAQMLLQRFQSEDWGAAQEDSGSDDDEEATSPAMATATVGATTGEKTQSGTVRVTEPPADHPVWGLNGIMQGIVVNQASKKYQIDPRYRHRKRLAKVYGDNGLPLGAWFPRQICALYHGAHGMSQGGICGTSGSGAYSVVVSGTYATVDEDLGDSIWYSVPGSDKNKKKDKIADSRGTKALEESMATRNPVRVLRSGKKDSVYAPSVGFRYDGLYEVVEQDKSHQNSGGGLAIRFLLVRIPGQTSLEDIRRASPTAQEMAEEGCITDLW